MKAPINTRLLLLALLTSRVATASPRVSIDDPVYETLEDLRAQGKLSRWEDGLLPLSATRVDNLLATATSAPPRFAGLHGWWFTPIERAFAQAQAVHERPRAYSSAQHPRNVVGALALSCEDREGQPCGDGLALITELDTSAGYATWLSASTRILAVSGNSSYGTSTRLDRAHIDGELGPVAVTVGRDAFALGPSAKTHAAWSANAPAMDQVRIASTRPLSLGHELDLSGQYVLGSLRAPQTYPGNLVSIARLQLGVGPHFTLGTQQLLQLGGAGAPQFDAVDFILEHFRRRDLSSTATDSSNRRFGFDCEGYWGRTRVYYELIFEDIRRWLGGAVAYDADHVFGVEIAGLDAGALRGLLFEVQKTGARSEEHTPRVTGFTNEGRVVGNPLGPDSKSLFIATRLRVDEVTLLPWIQVADLSSDVYSFPSFAPIVHVSDGVDEVRVRTGVRMRTSVAHELALQLDAMAEHVARFDFLAGKSANNVELAASFVWQPRWRL